MNNNIQKFDTNFQEHVREHLDIQKGRQIATIAAVGLLVVILVSIKVGIPYWAKTSNWQEHINLHVL